MTSKGEAIISIQAVLDRYDVTESPTFLQLKTCHADMKNNTLIASTMGEISDQDWAAVLANFNIDADAEFELDTAIIDGVHFIRLTFT